MANLFIKKTEGGKLEVSGNCTVCGTKFSVPNVDEIGYNNWRRGTPIHKALPDIKIDDATLMQDSVCVGGHSSQSSI